MKSAMILPIFKKLLVLSYKLIFYCDKLKSNSSLQDTKHTEAYIFSEYFFSFLLHQIAIVADVIAVGNDKNQERTFLRGK